MDMACEGSDMELMELFIKYLEGKMIGAVTPDMLCDSECFVGPEVGEGALSQDVLFYRGGTTSIIKASTNDLESRGLLNYPHNYLTTEHSLILTRALATLHANTLIAQKTSKSSDDFQPQFLQLETNEQSTNNSTNSEILENDYEKTENLSERVPFVQPGCVKDPWTAQVTRLHLVQSNLAIMVDALQHLGGDGRTLRRLEALKSDLPTLTQFLQFASAMQTQRIPSIGPICINDVWIATNEEEEEVLAVRLRGGKSLQAPPLRDAAWTWLTLLRGDILRERYMELCDDYCNAFNKVLLHKEASNIIEEMSYFDVMRDLGENFLHAFLTIIHKFVVSGQWYFDRQLNTEDGLQTLVEVIGFLVDNGIVGSIFVI